MKKALGLYLHIPFCKSKCLYCDFCSLPRADEELKSTYVAAMHRAVEAWGARAHDYTVDTVYFGGGTPTSLSARALTGLLEAVDKHFSLSPDCEITTECNPMTGEATDFSALRTSGFNRLSIGVQSLHREELRALGRLHTGEDFFRTLEAARTAGFENISTDVMSGIPGQTLQSYLETLTKLAESGVEHLSAYGLIVEEGTPFHRLYTAGRLALPDEDTAAAMYFRGIDLLARYGLSQYEISNFAREGRASRHNLKYWHCEDYLGIGAAAHSYFEGDRFGITPDVAAFADGRALESERETVTRRDAGNEFVMLGMRLADGISNNAFQARFGESLDARFGALLARYIPTGHVVRTEDGYAFTKEGMYVSNAILSDILDFDA